MKEFFHGWRRKTGVVTLPMAFLFAVGWLRSCLVHDHLGFMPGGYGIRLTSEFRRMRFGIFWPLEGVDLKEYTHLGFSWDYGEIVLIEAMHISATVPYWFPTQFLTLLSAYLILWVPRRAKLPDQLTNPDPHSN